MIEWIVGGILLLGAVGKKLAESDNSGASHIGNGLEKLSDGTKNKICEMGEAKILAFGFLKALSSPELLKKARSGSTIDRAAAAAEYKSRHSDD